MVFFKTRKAARDFAGSSKKIVDRGPGTESRWGVKVI